MGDTDTMAGALVIGALIVLIVLNRSMRTIAVTASISAK